MSTGRIWFARRFVRPIRDWTLNVRLVLSMLGLLVVLCVAIGVCTQFALKHFLTGRLDDQLSAAGGRSAQAFQGQGPVPRNITATPRPLGPGQAVGTIFARISTDPAGINQSSAYLLAIDTSQTTLGQNVVAELAKVPADNKPHTVELPNLKDYRVIAARAGDGDVLVTGLPLTSVHDTLRNLTLIITALSIAGLLIAAAVGYWIVRLALRPLRRVTATASRVAELPLDSGEVALAERVPEPNPHTEVGQVGVAFNHMLENVNQALNARHQSEIRVRQFVADASHELRTPLASIRGYAELTRRSRQDAPQDVQHALSRVESEAHRMSSMVEDLLLLARLDEGRPLEREQVDLSRLIVDVLSDAYAAGPEHSWQLELPDEPISVIGDSARLHQVLANILANARTHTPAGTRVLVAAQVTADAVVVTVNDNGPGIPQALVPDIFERFSRGEQSRVRSAGSTGLGLAIVHAVVAAHNGTIEVSSTPGNTTFTVRLPLHGRSQVPSQSSARLASHAH